MTMIRDDLLEPELTERPQRELFSTRSMFLVSFLGGPFCALAFCSLNVFRLNRLTRDAVWLLCAAVVACAPFVFMVWDPGVLAFFSAGDSRLRGLRYVSRIAALLVFGLLYWRQRAFLNACANGFGRTANPWKPALVVLVVAGLAQGGLAALLLKFFG